MLIIYLCNVLIIQVQRYKISEQLAIAKHANFELKIKLYGTFK